MRKIPRESWPTGHSSVERLAVYVDMDYLVQVFATDVPGVLRLSVNRTAYTLSVDGHPKWHSGIEWDELQDIKRACGYGGSWAVECFPPDSEVVNVANMRHLWLLPEAPPYAWGRDRRPTHD